MNEVILKVGQPVVMTRIGVGGYYASQDGTENPSEIFGIGSWKKYSPANTVNELMDLDGEDDFVIVGDLYVWERIS